ncbi:unnamed protein product [Mucor circinelloides]
MNKEQDDIELLDSDDSDIESIGKNQEQPDEPDRDLAAKEDKALMSVASMLCMSSSIHGDITQDYLKKQLYIDRRECISSSALNFCCRIANAVKCLVPKEDGSPFQWRSLFQMRNSVVSFLPRFKQEKAKKSISTDSRQRRKSVIIDAAVLHLLLAKELDVYKSGGTEFTNWLSIRSSQKRWAFSKTFFSIRLIKSCHSSTTSNSKISTMFICWAQEKLTTAFNRKLKET